MSTMGPYKATVIREHDGDTISVDILLRKQLVGASIDEDLGFNVHRRRGGIWLVNQSVRTFGDNAPELATPEGKAALAYLQTLLPLETEVTLLSRGWDKYGGRIDGTVTLPNGHDLTQAMIDAGHAVYWNGKGPRPAAGLVVE